MNRQLLYPHYFEIKSESKKAARAAEVTEEILNCLKLFLKELKDSFWYRPERARARARDADSCIGIRGIKPGPASSASSRWCSFFFLSGRPSLRTAFGFSLSRFCPLRRMNYSHFLAWPASKRCTCNNALDRLECKLNFLRAPSGFSSFYVLKILL